MSRQQLVLHRVCSCLQVPEPATRCAGAFPKSVCTSVNEVLCHGIPDSRQLRDGDIINVDVTVYLDVRPFAADLRRWPHQSCLIAFLERRATTETAQPCIMWAT